MTTTPFPDTFVLPKIPPNAAKDHNFIYQNPYYKGEVFKKDKNASGEVIAE